MTEYPDDLIKEFKSKVEEAISLLPQIPEVHRHEVWTYWQIISVAVKAAVGGRGPIVAKQTAAKQARPRGRPRLHGYCSRSSMSESGPKNPVENKSRGVRNPGRKGKAEEQKLSNRKNKSSVWSSGPQSDSLGAGNRVHFSDRSSVASATSVATTVTGKQSSFAAGTSDSMNHLFFLPVATEKLISSVSKDSTIDRISPGVLDQTSSMIVKIEGTSSRPTAQDDFMSQSVQVSAAELPDILGNDLSQGLKAQTMHALQLANKPHRQRESSYAENQTTLLAKTTATSDSEEKGTKQASSEMEISDYEPPQRAQTLAVSLHETLQNRTTDETRAEILRTSPDRVESFTKSTRSIVMESETREGHIADSTAGPDSVKQTTEKSAKGKASAQTLGNLSAETVQSVSAAETSQCQRTETDADTPQQCQDLPTRLDHGGSDNTTADALLNSDSPDAKSALSAHGSTASVKRKRGRPRKYTGRQSQDFPARTSPHIDSSVSSQSDKLPSKSSVCTDSADKGMEVSSSADKKTERDFLPAASDKKKSKLSNRDPTLTAVRRSERRAVPTRDNIFCYFTPRQHRKLEEEDVGIKEEEEEVEEEEESSVSEEQEEERVGDAVEEEEVKERTEEEKQKQRTCPKCQVVLMSASSIAAHMRTHTGERPFACPVCHKTFTTKGNCERHEVTHVGLKAFTCPQCNKKFTEKKSLKIHMRAHTGERPYQCRQCGMRFFQSGTLKTHMDRHTGHKGHLCELCGKAFRQSCQLRVHMRRHKLHMPFQCQHCSRTFYTKSDMERHELKHTGERPFPCDQCPKTFTRVQYLREHQNSHLGRRPYKCIVCGLTFHTFASCHRHVNKHKLPDHHGLDQAPQHIHVEVTPDTPAHQVMEQVQVILDQQPLTDFQTPHIQTFIIPDPSVTHATATPGTIVGPNPQSSAHAILSNLGLEVEESSEMYHVTLVDPAQTITIPADPRMAAAMSTADFSAINLLANATTQLSAPP